MNPNKALILITVALIFLHVIFIFGSYYLPHMANFRYNGYLITAAGGDETGYLQLARMIYNFDLHEHPWTLGFPLFITPLLFIFGASMEAVFLPIVILNGIILYSIAIALVVWTAWMIFGRLAAAFWSGFLFSFFPLIFYVFRDIGPHFSGGTWNDFNFLHANWVTAMTDPLSAFLTLLIFCLLIRSLDVERSWQYYSFLGFLGGYAMMVRLSNIVVLAIVVLVMIIRHNWRKLPSFVLSAIAGFLPQFIYNYNFFGSPIRFGYQKEYQAWIQIGAAVRPVFSIDNFTHLIARAAHYSWLTVPAFILIAGIVVAGVRYIARRNKLHGVIVCLWFALPVAFYMFFTTGQTAMRYYLPAVPAFILLFVGVALEIKERLNFFQRKSL